MNWLAAICGIIGFANYVVLLIIAKRLSEILDTLRVRGPR
jgi:hypothetical protein